MPPKTHIMATTTKGTEITAMPSATLSTTKRVIVRARPYPNAVAVAGAAGAVAVVIVMVDDAVAVCGTGGKAPHNFIPLGDQVFQHIVQAGERREERSHRLFHGRQVHIRIGGRTMPDIVGGEKLLYASQAVLVVRLKDTTDHRLIL
jgi:hypothetical protein